MSRKKPTRIRSLVLDRTFPGIGRIHRASGTESLDTHRQMSLMLTTLYGAGRVDVLHAIRDGILAPMVVFGAFRSGRLEELPAASGLLPFGVSYESWRLSLDCSAWHRQSLKASGVRLVSVRTTAELPAILLRLRQTMAGTPRAYNLTVAAARAFLRDTLTRADPLYRAVAAIEPLRVRPTMERRPQTPSALFDALAGQSDPFATACWSMATTGMGPGEYWGLVIREPEGLHIHGTKRVGRDRYVPNLWIARAPQLSRQVFEDTAAKLGMFTAYDLRRSFAGWMEAAGIPRTRRRLYMGHGAKDVTDLYEWTEVVEFLTTDAEKMRAWLGTQDPRCVPLLAQKREWDNNPKVVVPPKDAPCRNRTYNLVIKSQCVPVRSQGAQVVGMQADGPSVAVESARVENTRIAPEVAVPSPDVSPDGVGRS